MRHPPARASTPDGLEPASRPRLCFVSLPPIRALAMPVVAEFAHRAEVEVVDGSFDAALELAQARIEAGRVDAFVSAGSNAALLRRELKAPVATIQLGGFDLLQALIRAREHAECVGVVTYGRTLPELESVRALLRVDVRQYAYDTPDAARRCIAALRDDGVGVVVGSSLVVESARNAGLQGLLAYSIDSVRRGFEDAMELARVARLENGRYGQLDSVLRTLRQAVLAVDRDGRVIAANPAMHAALGEPGLLGRELREVAPELLPERGAPPEPDGRDASLRLRGRDWLIGRTPIVEQGRVTGTTITLSDARQVQEADTALRIHRRRHDPPGAHGFERMLGSSPAFVRALETGRRLARGGRDVLITGETGVGKELFARALHAEGPTAGQPFVAVNCAAFPESLLEGELFGHEDGAFTGARRGGRRGLIEAAHRGTLFLDEIGDMPLPLQSRLLRVLQEREVVRLGGTAPVPVELRVIAATHQDLGALVAQGRFRRDLYYRIDALRLAVPPLRDRGDDVATIAVALLRRELEALGSALPPGAVLRPIEPLLRAHPWPGNVRELQNVVRRLAAWAAACDRVEAVDHAGWLDECPELAPAATRAPAAAPRDDADGSRLRRARRALQAHGGRPGAAARSLGVSRSTLWRWLREDASDRPLAHNDGATTIPRGPEPHRLPE